MSRRIVSLLFAMTMIMLLLAGCGKSVSESTNGNIDVSNTEADIQTPASSEKETGVDATVEDQTDSNSETDENISYPENTFSLCWDEELQQSAVVSYDAEKVELMDLSYNSAEFKWLEKNDVTFRLMCEYENPSVEDLYQEEMKSLEEDYMAVSELAQKEVGNYTVWRSDAIWESDGTAGFEFFALQLENGMILYAVYLPGFENQVYLEEILPYVLENVTTGDGTWIVPTSYVFPEDRKEDSSEAEEDSFMEVTSVGGVNVKVYYDPEVITSCYTWEPEFFVTDADGNEYAFAIADFPTAEARRQGRMDYFTSQDNLYLNVDISDLQESQAGEYIIKTYGAFYNTYSYDGSGELIDASYWESVIELNSDVVVVYEDIYWDKPEIGSILNAMKFVVE